MKNIWFAGDTHFGHDNLRKHYPARAAFASVQEQDEWMIQDWNSKVRPRDDVYFLGDFGCFNQDHEVRVINRLHGRIHYVPGNHDRKLIKRSGFQKRVSTLFPFSYGEVKIDGTYIVLSHFPIWEWERMHYGSWHIHGHVHAKPTGVPGKIFDAGVDGNNLSVYNFEEVRDFMNSREIRTHHPKG